MFDEFDLENNPVAATLGMLTEGGSGLGNIGEGGFTIPGMDDESSTPEFETATELSSSLTELADFLTGLQDRTGPGTFLGSLQAAPDAYAMAFQNFGMALMGLAEGGGGGGGADPQEEFTLVAEAFIAAGDAVLAAAAREVGEDENEGSESGVVFAVDALVTALDTAGAAISNAFQEGSIAVMTAAVTRFITEVEAAMMGQETDPDAETPGEMFAGMIADGAEALAGGVDTAFNALTGDEGLGQLAAAITENYPAVETAIRDGAGDLAMAITGDDSGPSPLDGLTDMLMDNPIADAIGGQEGAPSADDLTALLMDNPIADAIGGQEGAPSADDLMAVGTGLASAIETGSPDPFINALQALAPAGA